jgi:hypothetical protein
MADWPHPLLQLRQKARQAVSFAQLAPQSAWKQSTRQQEARQQTGQHQLL